MESEKSEKPMCNECQELPARSRGLCKNCYARFIYHQSKNAPPVSISQLQKGWIKMEGSKRGYSTPQENREWNCQACGLVQPTVMPAYLFLFDDSEILRICPLCQSFVATRNISDFFKLLEIVRESFEAE